MQGKFSIRPGRALSILSAVAAVGMVGALLLGFGPGLGNPVVLLFIVTALAIGAFHLTNAVTDGGVSLYTVEAREEDEA